MLPFHLVLTPGVPVSDQVVYAVTKAIVAGRLRPGDEFPSVRVLSQELRINPEHGPAHRLDPGGAGTARTPIPWHRHTRVGDAAC